MIDYKKYYKADAVGKNFRRYTLKEKLITGVSIKLRPIEKERKKLNRKRYKSYESDYWYNLRRLKKFNNSIKGLISYMSSLDNVMVLPDYSIIMKEYKEDYHLVTHLFDEKEKQDMWDWSEWEHEKDNQDSSKELLLDFTIVKEIIKVKDKDNNTKEIKKNKVVKTFPLVVFDYNDDCALEDLDQNVTYNYENETEYDSDYELEDLLVL